MQTTYMAKPSEVEKEMVCFGRFRQSPEAASP